MSCPMGYGSAPPPAAATTAPLEPSPTTQAHRAPSDAADSGLPPPVYYHDYLQLGKILTAQHLKSGEEGREAAHDEHLFIVVHQAYELWFKQIHWELDAVAAEFQKQAVGDRELFTVNLRLGRVVEILKLLVSQFAVLETMQPLDFLDFRSFLLPSSGFQSWQFRLLENRLGLDPQRTYQNVEYYKYFSPAHQAMLTAPAASANLRKLIESWLERTPFLNLDGYSFWAQFESAARSMLASDRARVEQNSLLSPELKDEQLKECRKTEDSFGTIFSEAQHQALLDQGRRQLSHRATQAALLIFLYRDEPHLQAPFHCLTALVEIDEQLTRWRHQHMLMVHRMIGTKVGTGGSTGYGYLMKTVTQERYRAFSDFFNLSTFFIPRAALPQLPPEVRARMAFSQSHSTTASASATTATTDTPAS